MCWSCWAGVRTAPEQTEHSGHKKTACGLSEPVGPVGPVGQQRSEQKRNGSGRRRRRSGDGRSSSWPQLCTQRRRLRVRHSRRIHRAVHRVPQMVEYQTRPRVLESDARFLSTSATAKVEVTRRSTTTRVPVPRESTNSCRGRGTATGVTPMPRTRQNGCKTRRHVKCGPAGQDVPTGQRAERGERFARQAWTSRA